MKKYFFHTIVLFIIVSNYSLRADVNSIMQKGNEFYKSNQYQLAIDEYNKLIKQGFEGESIYYNLGNAHYRLGKVGYAILYYEKALKLSPADEDSKHNLSLAMLNLKDKVDTLPPFFIFNIWEGLLAAFSVSGWSIIVYVAFIFLLITVITYFFSKTATQQRISFFTAIGVLVLFLLTTILLTIKMSKEFNIKNGIIVQSSVTVKSSPDNSSKDEFVIHEGLKVHLEDKVDNWVKIRLEDGKIGWILEKNLRQI